MAALIGVWNASEEHVCGVYSLWPLVDREMTTKHSLSISDDVMRYTVLEAPFATSHAEALVHVIISTRYCLHSK